MHGAFSISYSTLGLKEKDQSCHHEVWVHLSHADPRCDRAAQYKHAQRLHLKEKTSTYDHSTQKKQGSLGTKRPLAQFIAHPYNPYVLP